MARELYTIGHSNHAIDKFIELLSLHQINVVCDVRSTPYSKHNPQFNQKPLCQSLKQANISYVFLGKELGARSDDPTCYVEGKIQYGRLAQTDLFRQGLDRLRNGMTSYRIALMCAEKDPITCHRSILICHQLKADDVEIKHILWNGKIEHNTQSEKRLMQVLRIQQDLFTSIEELIERAYDIQGKRIAYIAHSDDAGSILEEAEA